MNNDKLSWCDDCDGVFGRVADFESEEDFINAVIEDYKNFSDVVSEVSNVKIETCISTAEGIDPETIVKLKDTDIVIENYYTADVEEAEE